MQRREKRADILLSVKSLPKVRSLAIHILYPDCIICVLPILTNRTYDTHKLDI